MAGPEDGPPVLLLHGATVPGWEFDRIAPYLHAGGYRTVCPDLFGHGYSDRPAARHDHAMFVRQVRELLDRLGIDRPVSLFGHSLGAAIGARFAAEHEARVARLVMAAPLLDFLSLRPVTRLLGLPLIGELLTPTYVIPMLKRRRARSYRTIEGGRFVGMFRDQFLVPGFGGSFLSMLRSGSLGDQSDCYRRLSRTAHPLMVLRGDDDRIFTAAQLGTVRRLLGRATVLEFPDMGHPLMLTHPEAVAPPVVDFLAGIDATEPAAGHADPA